MNNLPSISRTVIGSGGKIFQPSQLAGLAAWYSADYGVLNSISPDTPATDGQTVRRWLDRSGNGRHMNQSTLANQPTFVSGAVTGDGLNARMTSSSWTVPAGCWMAGVLKVNSFPAAETRIMNLANQLELAAVSTGSIIKAVSPNDSFKPGAQMTISLGSVVFLYAMQQATGGNTILIPSTLVESKSSTASALSSAVSGTLALMSYSNGSSVGDVSLLEVMAGSGDVRASLPALLSYFRKRWGAGI